jgi:hypothetical protein
MSALTPRKRTSTGRNAVFLLSDYANWDRDEFRDKGDGASQKRDPPIGLKRAYEKPVATARARVH